MRKEESKALSFFAVNQKRYILNELIDSVPKKSGEKPVVNVHFEGRESLHTYWKIIAVPDSKTQIYLQHGLTKVLLKPLNMCPVFPSDSNEFDFEKTFFKFFVDAEEERKISTILDDEEEKELPKLS